MSTLNDRIFKSPKIFSLKYRVPNFDYNVFYLLICYQVSCCHINRSDLRRIKYLIPNETIQPYL